MLDRLNGNKTFVLGNHDEDNNVAELLKYGKVCGAVKYKSKYWLTHIPIHPECLQEYQVNIHGHLHDLLIRNHSFMAALDSTAENKKRYFNVSCEQVNFIPKTLQELGLEYARIKHMAWNTDAEFKKDYKEGIAECPKCKCKTEFDID